MPLLDYVNHVSQLTNGQKIDHAKQCDVYGTCAKLYRFVPQEDRNCGDRLTYNCLDPIDIKIEIQPRSESEGEKMKVMETLMVGSRFI